MTSYTYKPGIGVSTISDANNQITYYEYDSTGKALPGERPIAQRGEAYELSLQTRQLMMAMKQLIVIFLFSLVCLIEVHGQGISGATNVCPSTDYAYSVTISGGGGIGSGLYAWFINGVRQRFVAGPSVTLNDAFHGKLLCYLRGVHS